VVLRLQMLCAQLLMRATLLASCQSSSWQDLTATRHMD
jgi:hypothetical protein